MIPKLTTALLRLALEEAPPLQGCGCQGEDRGAQEIFLSSFGKI